MLMKRKVSGGEIRKFLEKLLILLGFCSVMAVNQQITNKTTMIVKDLRIGLCFTYTRFPSQKDTMAVPF